MGKQSEFFQGRRAGLTTGIRGLGAFCSGGAEYVAGFLSGLREGTAQRMAHERAQRALNAATSPRTMLRRVSELPAWKREVKE